MDSLSAQEELDREKKPVMENDEPKGHSAGDTLQQGLETSKTFARDAGSEISDAAGRVHDSLPQNVQETYDTSKQTVKDAGNAGLQNVKDATTAVSDKGNQGADYLRESWSEAGEMISHGK